MDEDFRVRLRAAINRVNDVATVVGSLRRGTSHRGRETATILLLLVLAATFAYGSHVLSGAFYIDDWSNASRAAFAEPPRLVGAAQANWDVLGWRPLLAVALAAPHVALGTDPRPHLLLAVVLAVVLSLLVHLLLRTVGLERLPAAAVALLVLLFPAADSTRLWAAASLNQLAVIAYLLGLLLALAALRRGGGRRSLALHALSLLLWLAGVLTYEIAAPAMLLSGLFYVRVGVRSHWRTRWAVDAVVVGAALAYTGSRTTRAAGVGALELVEYLPYFARSVASVVGRAVIPFSTPHVGLLAIVTVAAAAAAVLRARVRPRSHEIELRRWLAVAAISIPTIGVAYAMFVPSAYWSADWPGLMNRINLLAAIPIAALVVATAALTATLLIPAEGRMRSALFTALVLVICSGYIVDVRSDARDYARAAELQAGVLGGVQSALPQPRAGSTIFTFGHVNQSAPNIPVFSTTWDLQAALQLLYRDPTLRAAPTFSGTTFACTPTRVEPLAPLQPYDLGGQGLSRRDGARYGRVYFVDVSAPFAVLVESRADCESWREFDPGPFLSRAPAETRPN